MEHIDLFASVADPDDVTFLKDRQRLVDTFGVAAVILEETAAEYMRIASSPDEITDGEEQVEELQLLSESLPVLARIIESVVLDYDPVIKRDRRSRKYDWDRWFDGEKHVLARGVDYEITTGSMRAMALATASRRHPNRRARTRAIPGKDDAFTLQLER